MQKRIKIVMVSIVLIILLIGIIVIKNNSNSKYSFTQEEIKYALTLDGEKITSFPSKGIYKVQVTCVGADGRWLYDEWKLAIENITGDVSCDINFSTINKTGLNDYIIGLSGTTQGEGKVINERVNIPDYSKTTAISQSAYTNQSTFSSSTLGDTSGTTVSGMYIFSNNQWTTSTSSMKSGTYYNFKFTTSESGYYQLCYNLSSGSPSNGLYVLVNQTPKYMDFDFSLNADPLANKSGCIELGYVSTSDDITVVQYAVKSGAYNISNLSFNMKKVTSVQRNVNAGIRYEGKNPNNYIWFNNEYWRIIGAFDSASHGQSGKNLVKIIRDDILGDLVWEKSNINDWSLASLKSLLNHAYYNAQDGTNSGYCYGYDLVTTNCDYTKKGIQSGYREMITNVTWYLGGSPNPEVTSEAFYGYERGTEVYSGNSSSTTGYIGLMYPSDFGFSVLSSSCARTTNLGSYSSAKCAGQSWLYGKGSNWMLTPCSLDSSFVSILKSRGHILYYSGLESGQVVRPVLYLDASVYKIDGDGSLKKPYIIGM